MSIVERQDFVGSRDLLEREEVLEREELLETEDLLIPAVGRRPHVWLRRLRGALLTVFTAQYTIVAIGVGLSVAATLHYLVTPKIVATFDALTVALKH
jgi:hypothetical protein